MKKEGVKEKRIQESQELKREGVKEKGIKEN